MFQRNLHSFVGLRYPWREILDTKCAVNDIGLEPGVWGCRALWHTAHHTLARPISATELWLCYEQVDASRSAGCTCSGARAVSVWLRDKSSGAHWNAKWLIVTGGCAA